MSECFFFLGFCVSINLETNETIILRMTRGWLRGQSTAPDESSLSSFLSLITQSTPPSSLLLGLLDGLRGMTSEFVTSECVLKSYATGNIQLVNQTNMQQIAQFTAHFSSNVNKVQACNLAAFVPLEERTPMQRAEWIKYLATFTNLEARANIIYDAIKENYNCLTKAAANLTTRFKPIVAWVEYKQGLWGFSRKITNCSLLLMLVEKMWMEPSVAIAIMSPVLMTWRTFMLSSVQLMW
ncbi:hypothetical protein HPP92_014171 [Vanilla planifolia]|uniref:Uncharacterized protein n=1 Tax=Vanilla planifolia TaxID=51239 RepID=A0A835QJI7_VANPL|nr:hypothetical protein HPP92_014171 [Vanilla planifolia]